MTTTRLYQFGGTILALILLLSVVAIVGSRQQSAALTDNADIAQMRSDLQTADMMHDAIRAVVFGSGLEAEIGPDQITALRAELDEDIATFTEAIDSAASKSSTDEIAALFEDTLGKVQAYGDTSVQLFGKLSDLTSADPAVAADAASRYDSWTLAFEDLKVNMESLTELIGAEVERGVAEGHNASGNSILFIVVGLLVAAGAFAFVWRRVLVSVARTNALKAETERIGSMVENSPTNTMFCDTEMRIQYMNPASTNTLRKIERLLPCKVDDIIGQSVDIFHKNPAHQRQMLGNPDQYLPHTAVIPLGDEFMELNVSAIRDANGTHIGAMANWSLVTDKLRIEREAKELQERERAAAADLQTKVTSLSTTLAAAAAGDLTAQVTVVGDDAIGQMGTAVAKLLGDLRGSIQAIAVNSEALAAAAEELQVVSAQMGGNSAETSR
ncbi:MAG: hypothetical protein NTZ21_03550, partial [Actinobacteria bacterium]|nr:hypothetical protein [Actinomycetota bacterium]